MLRFLNNSKRPQADWLEGLFSVPLKDLGSTDLRHKGVFIPEPEIGIEKVGISEQFLENAEIYHQKYSGSADMEKLLLRVFEHAGVSLDAEPVVLDIGSGSGTNSVLPVLALMPKAQFVCTDLSPDLLAILRRYAVEEGLQGQIGCVCTDAMRNHFIPGQYDIVVGVSILHHLIDPEAAIRAARAALKPGGIAIFCDPFEGYAMLGLAFRLILQRAERERLELFDSTSQFMKSMIIDFDARRGTDKSDIRFRYMDDKWLFTRSYFESIAKRLEFRSLDIIPNLNHDVYFRSYARTLFKLGPGLGEEALPGWAWETIDMIDESFSLEMKQALLTDGSIILRK